MSSTRFVLPPRDSGPLSQRFAQAPGPTLVRSRWRSLLRFLALALSPLLVLAGLVILIINVFGPIDAYEACASQRGQSVEAADPVHVERKLMPVTLTCTFSDGTQETMTDATDTAWPVGLIVGGLALTVVGLSVPVPSNHVRRLVEDSELTPHVM
ncbi:hypothetical protein [Kytococcus sedentarius]|uniref:hypothetical protein n=1 Tax=Kytococcus sedentarius TaxID=1276 RepID=UPI0035BC0A4F